MEGSGTPCYTRRPYGLVPRQAARRRGGRRPAVRAADCTPGGPAARGASRSLRVSTATALADAARRHARGPLSRRPAPGRPAGPRGSAHRHLRHPHQPAAGDRRRGGGPAGADRLARGEDLPLLPRAGRAGAVLGHPGADREPPARLLPRRGHHHPRQRPDHPDLRSRSRGRRQGPRLPARLHHGDRLSAADHPRRRLRAAARARVAAVPARHPDGGGQPRRRRRLHHQDAVRGRGAGGARPARPRSSSPPVRRRSWCCSWSSVRPARRPSPRSSGSRPRRCSGNSLYCRTWG